MAFYLRHSKGAIASIHYNNNDNHSSRKSSNSHNNNRNGKVLLIMTANITAVLKAPRTMIVVMPLQPWAGSGSRTSIMGAPPVASWLNRKGPSTPT